MNRHPRPLARLAVAALLAAVLLPATAASVSAQEKRKRNPPDSGTHGFRFVLNEFKQKPLGSVAELNKNPEETLLVVLGKLDVLDQIALQEGGLGVFRSRGGAILIASDYGSAIRLNQLGVEISGHDVWVREDQPPERSSAYQGDTRCPVIRQGVNQGHPLFQDLTRGIVPNNPSFLTLQPECDLTWLARFPEDCLWSRFGRVMFIDPRFPELNNKVGPDRLFMVGSDTHAPPRDRVLIVASQTVFLNGMMRLDNDNLTFTFRCVRWLTNNGQRKYVLFVHNNTIVTDFNVPLSQFPIPWSRWLSTLLRGLEQENRHNELFLDWLPRERIVYYLVILFSVGLALYGLRRLARSRFRLQPHVPLVAARVARIKPDVPVAVHRYRAVLESGQLWEAAQTLARDCFEEFAPDGDPAKHGRPVPTRGTWQQRHALERKVERLWQLAASEEPVPVSPMEFERLLELVRAVRAALAHGTLRFPQTAPTT
jgi:hypothetical protein